MTDLEDIDVIEAILKPNNPKKRLFQEELYKRYISRVYEKCYFMAKDKAMAKDLAHDVFILVFTKLNTFKNLSPFFGWIDAITYHHCLAYLRKKKILVTKENEILEILDIEDETEHDFSKEDSLNDLESAFNAIPADMKLILLMKYRYGLGIKEIMEHLELSESAVKMRLKRSRDYLASALKR